MDSWTLPPQATHGLASCLSSADAHWSDQNLFDKNQFLLSICQGIDSETATSIIFKQFNRAVRKFLNMIILRSLIHSPEDFNHLVKKITESKIDYSIS